MFGTCRLCLNEKDLVDGHLISAGILRQLRAPALTNPNPLTVTNRIAVQTSEPISDYVMCRECDNLLGARGENWTIPNLATMTEFPIRNLLQNATPLMTYGRLVAYEGNNVPGLDMESLCLFGLSFFWKCASFPWRDKTNGRIDIDLGPYRELLRDFLLGKSAFPNHMALHIAVPDNEVLLGAYTPILGTERDFHNFVCYVPGVEFTLCVGKRVPPAIRSCCAYTSPRRLIFLSGGAADTTRAAFRHLHQSARPARGVKRMLDEIRLLKESGRI